MSVESVQVPGELLLAPELTASAKVVWMVDHLLAAPGGAGLSALMAGSGLSRPTVQRALSRLDVVGWSPSASGGSRPGATASGAAILPGALLRDGHLGAEARVLYGVLQLIPGYDRRAGAFTYPNLADLMGASSNTIKLAVNELVQSGWLQVSQKHRRAPVQFSLYSPGEAAQQAEAARLNAEAARLEAELARVKERLTEAEFRGEALMREYLSLIITSEEFIDNAAPGFLVNPLTGHRLQFDRFYLQDVAFEYNGPQHYGETQRFSAAQAARQRARDLIKLGICAERGIRLVVVHADDLTLAGMQKKTGDLLPLRDLLGYQPLIEYLESTSRRYRIEATRRRSRDEE